MHITTIINIIHSFIHLFIRYLFRFGRIGRLVTRVAFLSGKGQVVAINDPFIDVEYMVGYCFPLLVLIRGSKTWFQNTK